MMLPIYIEPLMPEYYISRYRPAIPLRPVGQRDGMLAGISVYPAVRPRGIR